MANKGIFGLVILIFVISFFATQTYAASRCKFGTKIDICDDNRIYLQCNANGLYKVATCSAKQIFINGNCSPRSTTKRCGLPCNGKFREVCDDYDDKHKYNQFYYNCKLINGIKIYKVYYCKDGFVFNEAKKGCRGVNNNDDDDNDDDDDTDEDCSDDDDDDDNDDD